jgi:hypothetical protein
MKELIAQVEAYATTDGKLHLSIFDARAHQHGIDIEQEVRNYMEENCSKYSMNYFLNLGAIIAWEKYKKAKELSK